MMMTSVPFLKICCKANYLLHVLSCCDPFVKTRLFSSYCLSLYGATLWRSSSPQLKSCHLPLEAIVILALSILWPCSLQSIYNVVLSRSRSLVTELHLLRSHPYSDQRRFFCKFPLWDTTTSMAENI